MLKGMKKALSLLCAGVLAVTLFAVSIPETAAAADPGRSPSDAIAVSDGGSGTLTWTKNSDHLYYYLKFTTTSRGVANFTFKKPTDSEGEFGSIDLNLYSADDTSTPFWQDSNNSQKANASDYYTYKIGLAAGTYYMAVKPGFFVYSGTITSAYSYSFVPRGDFEIEPNNSASKATVLTPGQRMNAVFETGNSEEEDYFRFTAQAGHNYKVYLGNFSAISASTTIIDMTSNAGMDVSLGYQLKKNGNYDDDGDYYAFSSEQDQTVTIRFWNNYTYYEYYVLVKDIGTLPVVTRNATTDPNDVYPDRNGDVEFPRKGQTILKNGYYFTRTKDNVVTCYDTAGNQIKDNFVSDGTFTYYMQADGTAMESRLTYHPDGQHVIYFDAYGHEIFSNFHKVLKSVSGDAVNDLCFFDINGYMYVNTVTYDQDGVELYYANPYGVLEQNGWFYFDPNANYGNSGAKWQFTGTYLGYANSDGTLAKDTYERYPTGDYLWMQANGEYCGY